MKNLFLIVLLTFSITSICLGDDLLEKFSGLYNMDCDWPYHEPLTKIKVSIKVEGEALNTKVHLKNSQFFSLFTFPDPIEKDLVVFGKFPVEFNLGQTKEVYHKRISTNDEELKIKMSDSAEGNRLNRTFQYKYAPCIDPGTPDGFCKDEITTTLKFNEKDRSLSYFYNNSNIEYGVHEVNCKLIPLK